MGLLDFLFARKPDRAAFGVLAARAIREAGGEEEIEFDDQEFCLRSKARGVMYLANAHAEYCATSRRDRPGVLQRLARVHLAVRKDWTLEEALPNLLPRVRERSYYGLMELRGRVEFGQEVTFPFLELADFLAVGVVVDQPDSVAELQLDRLREWNAPVEYLHSAARSNLARISEEPFVRVGQGVWRSPWRDSHDASRVVLTEVIRRLQVKGQHVAFLPNPETLIVTGSQDDQGLLQAAALTRQGLDAPRALMGRPLRLEGNQWSPFSVDAAHPAFRELERFRVDAAQRDHHEQKALLEKDLAARGDHAFVCTLTGVENKEDGRASTYAVWARDVVSLLPRADNIAFIWEASGSGHAMATWEDAVRCAGQLMVPVPGLHPPRWRVERFPDGEQLDAIRAASVEGKGVS